MLKIINKTSLKVLLRVTDSDEELEQWNMKPNTLSLVDNLLSD